MECNPDCARSLSVRMAVVRCRQACSAPKALLGDRPPSSGQALFGKGPPRTLRPTLSPRPTLDTPLLRGHGRIHSRALHYIRYARLRRGRLNPMEARSTREVKPMQAVRTIPPWIPATVEVLEAPSRFIQAAHESFLFTQDVTDSLLGAETISSQKVRRRLKEESYASIFVDRADTVLLSFAAAANRPQQIVGMVTRSTYS